MKNLKNYIYSQFGHSFFPIFIVLFVITSIVFLVKIASLTSVIKIDFIELLQLFSYTIGEILFYTLPVAFFVGMIVTLAKLSMEYELMVITSFGLKPINVLKILLPITIMFTVVLLVVSLGVIPKSKYLSSSMIKQKTKQASLNIKASEFGQKFGEWQVYIQKSDENRYYDLKMFKKGPKADHFISARSARTFNEKGDIKLVLDDGKYIVFDNKINQINFKTMKINNSIASTDGDHFKNSFEYWMKIGKERKHTEKFSFYILASFWPLLSLFLIIGISYFNPRYDKNRSAMFAIFCTIIYYTVAINLSKNILLYSIIIVPPIWLLFGYLVYYKRVKKIY